MRKLSWFLPRFWIDEPTEIQVYPCPACHETISVEAKSCRFCHLPIERKMAKQLLAENRRVTNAIVHANTFSLSKYFAVLVAVSTLLDIYMGAKPPKHTVGWPTIALAYGVYWLYKNRSIVTHDTDYPAAIAKVKWTMIVWGAVLLLQYGFYWFLNGLT